MTTKKSKPASLTSSLLARKGEAEPATAPYSIPESGRQQTADGVPAKGNGNGNGGDLGHALSAMTRRRSSGIPEEADDSLDVEGAENGVHADAVQSGPSSEAGSLIPPSDDGLDDGVSEMEDEVELDLDVDVDVAVSPEDEADTDTDTGTPEPEDEPSAEVTLLEGAVAEEASIEEAVIETSVAADNAAERIAAETAAAIEKAGTPESEEDLSGPDEEKTASDRASDDGKAETVAAMAPIAAAVAAEKLNETTGDAESAADGDREAKRDARLLRFVYAMAALTGIVAIVLYAGGWLRDVPKQGQTETSVASSAPAASGDSQVADGTASTDSAPSSSGTTEPSAMPATGTAGDSTPSASGGSADSAPAIPTAPPVTPPGTMSGSTPETTEETPVASDSGLTTGGPAKSTVETSAPSVPSSDTLTIEMPATGAESADTSQSAATAPVETPSAADAAPQETQKIDTSGAGSVAEGPATASSDAAESSSAESDASGVVVPTPITPETVAPPPVSTEPVRDVPNMRVLAPALVRPEPAETAPPTGTAPAATTPARAPTEQQTAALPKAPAAPSSGRYRVQLASVSSEAVAKREWARLQKVFPDVFGDRTLVVEKKDIAGRGTFYRIQTGGYETLADARDVCSILKVKKQACLPIKR